MNNIIAFICLIPFLIFTTFQPALLSNATAIEETISLAIYETQKKASLKGKYDEAIYKEIRDYLVENHHYRAEAIKIKGTETLTLKGEAIYVEVSVPKPPLTVIDMFKIDNSQPYKVKLYINSEYVASA